SLSAQNGGSPIATYRREGGNLAPTTLPTFITDAGALLGSGGGGEGGQHLPTTQPTSANKESDAVPGALSSGLFNTAAAAGTAAAPPTSGPAPAATMPAQ